MINFEYFYQTTRELPVTLVTHWQSSIMSSHAAIVPAGFVLGVSENTSRGDQYLQCQLIQPEQYAHIETHSIPQQERKHPDYRGYSVSIKLSDLAASCIPTTILEPITAEPEPA